MVDEILLKGPIKKSQGRGVLQSSPGDVDAANLERHGFLAPGGKEGGICFPVAPGIDRPPMPLTVPGVDLRHGDVVTQ